MHSFHQNRRVKYPLDKNRKSPPSENRNEQADQLKVSEIWGFSFRHLTGIADCLLFSILYSLSVSPPLIVLSLHCMIDT